MYFIFNIYLIFPNNYYHSVIICDIYIQSFIHIFAFFIFHISLYTFTYTYNISYTTYNISYTYVIFYTCHIPMLYICSIHIIYTGICNLIFSYHIMVHLRSFIFFFLFISSHMTNLYTYLYLYISNLYLFRSPVGVTGLIPIQRYLYTYLYFYLSYTCIYLILCMIYYDYHICLLFFLIFGPNMSSTFIILCMVGFLTQWAFHRV